MTYQYPEKVTAKNYKDVAMNMYNRGYNGEQVIEWYLNSEIFYKCKQYTQAIVLARLSIEIDRLIKERGGK